MSIVRYLNIYHWLYGTAIAISICQPATAKTAVEVNEIAQAITVRIESNDSIGTGVILQKQGDLYTILTAAHVVKKTAGRYTVFAPDGRSIVPIADSLRRVPGDIDLAVLKFRSTVQYPTPKIGNTDRLKIGMKVYIAGFPAPTAVITETVYVFRGGEISANSSKSFAQGYGLLYSNDTLPGMSGGPVFNEAGELVAIHGRGDRDRNGTGEKTNFNAGIPINKFVELARSIGVDLGKDVAIVPPNPVLKADDFFVSAYQKSERRDYPGALADYDRAIAIAPDYAEAYNNRGNLKSQHFQDAAGGFADYDRAIAIEPKLTQAYYNRGFLKGKLDNNSGAIVDYNQAIALNPNYAEAYNNRGIIKHKLGNSQVAIGDYDRAIQLNPNYAEAYYNRGVARSKLENQPLAIGDFDRAIALNPKYTEAYNNRGIAHQLSGNTQVALADYNRALSIDPSHAKIYNNRGTLKYEQLNDRAGAITDYNLAIALDSQDPEFYNNRGLSKEDVGETTAASIDFQQALKIATPNSLAALFSRGLINRFQAKLVPAVRDFDRAIELDRNFADAYFYRSMVKNSLGDRAKAMVDLQTAAKLYQQQQQYRSYQKALKQLQQLGMSEK
jgi:tetratricopeptide (TPR) repeat protein